MAEKNSNLIHKDSVSFNETEHESKLKQLEANNSEVCMDNEVSFNKKKKKKKERTHK